MCIPARNQFQSRKCRGRRFFRKTGKGSLEDEIKTQLSQRA